MEILYVFEKIRFPLLDEIMLLITRFGEETAFLAAALMVFWCVDKRRGYYVMTVGFLGTMLNQFLKLACAVPRPWVLDPEFTIVEKARAAATGYSFPSGHTQSAVGTFGALGISEKRKWLRRLFFAIAALVPVSRMYLGVHTLEDVTAASLMAMALAGAFVPMYKSENHRGMKLTIGLMLAVAVSLLFFAEFWPFPGDMDLHNLESGKKNAYTMLGCLTGVALVYGLERKYVRFDTRALWWVQILKVLLGLGAVLLVKEGLRAPLEAILPQYPARAVRYFLIVVVAGLLWPMTFRYFSKLGVKK